MAKEVNKNDGRTEEYAVSPINEDPTPSTSSEDGRKAHTRLSAESEDGRNRGQLGRDHHSGEEVGEAGPHRGLRRDGVGVGSLPSEGEGESGGHSHPVHSRDRGGLGLATAHGSEDCSHVGEGSGGRTPPWWQGRGDAVGNETGMGHERGVPQSFESGSW